MYGSLISNNGYTYSIAANGNAAVVNLFGMPPIMPPASLGAGVVLNTFG